jgi:type IV secretion system protein VirD4
MYKLSRLFLVLSIVLFVVVCTIIMKGLVFWVVLGILCLQLKKGKVLWSHGTARYASVDEIRSDKHGFPIGRMRVKRSVLSLFNPRLSAKEAVRGLSGYEATIRLPICHALVCAPSGAGKGTGLIIPHVLTCPDSMVVIEFKGETSAATRKARKKLGEVIEMAPFDGGTGCLNPLDFIDRNSPTAIEDCLDLAKSLVVRTGQEHDPHFCDAAEMFISTITMYVVYFAPPEDRSLQTVAGILANQEELAAAISHMQLSDAWDGMLARKACGLTRFLDRERASVDTTVARMMSFLDSPAIAAVTSKSTFDPADLTTSKDKMTLFLNIPLERQKAQAPFIRMVLNTIFRRIVSCGLQNNPIHVIVDDAASLGHMEALDDALDKYRAYGIRLTLVYQSLGQLKTCWPNGNDATVMGNTTNVFFGISDNATADYISTRMGEHTILVNSGGRNTSYSRSESFSGSNNSVSRSVSSSDNWQAQGRRLMKSEEIMALDQRECITLAPGLCPIRSRLVRYYQKGFREGFLSRSWMALKTLVVSFVIFIFMSILTLKAITREEVYYAPVDAKAGSNLPVQGEIQQGWDEEGIHGGIERNSN